MDEQMKQCEEELRAIMKKYGVLFKVVTDHRIEIIPDPANQKVTEIITDISQK